MQETAQMLYRRLFPREQLEDFVAELVFSYPKCFVTDSRLKRPLKKDIMLDLEKDKFLDDERREAAISYYTRDWNYEWKLEAGAKRIDLDGKEVGTVTKTEEREAKERVRLAQQARNQASKNVEVEVVNAAPRREVAAHAQSLTTPSFKPTTPSFKPTDEAAAYAPLGRLRKLWESLEHISASTDDAALRDALIVAALQVLITEATRLVESLKEKAEPAL
jgi:sRNA-binding protein